MSFGQNHGDIHHLITVDICLARIAFNVSFVDQARSAFVVLSPPIGFMEDDDWQDSGLEDDATEAPSKKPRSTRASTAAGSTSESPSSTPRPIPDCTDVKHQKKRLCVRHMRLFDAMRYQAKQEGETQLEAYNQAMIDQDNMVSAIVKFSAVNADVPGLKKKKKVGWAEFNKKYGTELAKTDHNQTAPFEKEQWLLKQINKFGRKRPEAEQQWTEYEANPLVKDDHFGFKGQKRLWLKKGEFIDNTKKQYLDGAATFDGERAKSPRERVAEAFRNHAHDMFNSAAGVNSGNAFFQGASISDGFAAATAASSNAEQDVDDSDLELGDEARGLPPNPKRGRTSDAASRVIGLEDSEGEKEKVDSKAKMGGKKRKVNVTDAKASLYKKIGDGIETARSQLSGLIITEGG